jgi:hypothetical protein
MGGETVAQAGKASRAGRQRPLSRWIGQMPRVDITNVKPRNIKLQTLYYSCVVFGYLRNHDYPNCKTAIAAMQPQCEILQLEPCGRCSHC